MGNADFLRRLRGSTLWLIVGCLALSALGAPEAAAEREGWPARATAFPVNKTQTLRGHGSIFVIDGPVVIPPHVEIRVELGVSIIGLNKGSLEVQGGLQIHGTMDNWVIVKDVDFSPTHKPKRGMHLDMADFRGCTFAQTEAKPYEGLVTIENCAMQSSCKFKWRHREGALNLMTVQWGTACVIYCAPPPKTKPKISIDVRTCKLTSLEIHGHGDATVRHCEIGDELRCFNVLKLMVDGCDIWTKLGVYQLAKDKFKKIKLTKCNLWSGGTVEVKREPTEGQKKERVLLQKFYFGPADESDPLLSKKAIGELILHGPGNAWIRLDKPRKSKHRLVPYPLWDTRPPPLR